MGLPDPSGYFSRILLKVLPAVIGSLKVMLITWFTGTFIAPLVGVTLVTDKTEFTVVNVEVYTAVKVPPTLFTIALTGM